MKPLTPHHRQMIVDFVTAGGSGEIDNAGRVCVGPLRKPIPGDAVAWLLLMTHGLIAGERGLVLATEEGRAMAEGHVGGSVRESRGQ